MRRTLRLVAIGIVVVVVLTVAGALAWTQAGPAPTERATRIAADAGATGYDWLSFGPDAGAVGVVLYPGARIDAEAYAPVARTLSVEAGVLVVVVDPPLDVALLDVSAADAVRAAHPDIDRWIVGGHSLGGVAASRYAADPDAGVAGLLLWASYPAEGDTIPDGVAVTSITGSRDEVLDRAAYDAARSRLPADAELVELDGVTHAQFGDYGEQPGDGTPVYGDVRARRAIARASAGLVERVADAP
jgi:pimeloyl-ACP methyl ester carboxylesterase